MLSRYGYVERTPEQLNLRRIYRWAFAVRAIIGITAWLLTVFLEIPMMEDALYYEEMGWTVANEWISGHSSSSLDWMIESERSAWVMVMLVAVFYLFFGGLRVVPLLIIAYSAVTAFVPVWIYRIARQVGANEKAARISAWLVVLSPGFAFWSSALYKEGLVHLLIGIVSFHTLRLQERWNLKSVWIVIAGLLLMLGLRFYLSAFLFVVVIAGLLWGRQHEGGYRILPIPMRQVSIVAILLMLLVGFNFMGRTMAFLPENLEEGFSEVQRTRLDLAQYGSGYLQDLDVSTFDSAVKNIPLAVTYFLGVPFPWQVGTLRQNMVIPETLFWIVLYPFIIIGVTRTWQENKQGVFFLLALSVTLCLFYALMVGNIGTAYRMRMQVWLLLSVFVGIGWEWWRARNSSNANR